MSQIEKIPVVVGVTGHKNIMVKDKLRLKYHIINCLQKIQELCKCGEGNDTPIIMLNVFAQGAICFAPKRRLSLALTFVRFFLEGRAIY